MNTTPPLSKYSFQYVTESYVSKISRSSQIIYVVFILTILAIGGCLPYFKINISVNSLAFIRPATEISAIRSIVNGRIKFISLSENKEVKKGEILLIISNEMLDEKNKIYKAQIEELSSFVSDLETLVGLMPTVRLLRTSLFKQEWLNYQQKLLQTSMHYGKVKLEFDRNKILHSQRVIADAEFERHQFEYENSKSDLEALKQNQLAQWQLDLHHHEEELNERRAQLSLIIKEKENLTIKAPVSGNIQNIAGIYAGSMVFANQDLAQISPDTSLIVESFVNPNDIGLLQKNMPVRFQVDAFNYNQWGLATGKVLEISNDIHVVNDRPVFKVKCILDKEYLQLKNGYKGYLKKGMTLQARFMVTERTLWQLLYDKVDDWVNPNIDARH